MRQRMQHRVDAAEVIEEEKHLRPIAGASLPVRIDQCVEIKQCGLVLSRRPRGEHEEPSGAPVAQTLKTDGGGAGDKEHVRPTAGVGEIEERLGMGRPQALPDILPRPTTALLCNTIARKSAQISGE